MTQHHDPALSQREIGQDSDNLVASVHGVGVARRRALGHGTRRGENLPPGAAPPVDPQVHQDLAGIRPGIGPAGALPGSVGALEGGLHQILGMVPVAGQQQRDAEKRRPDVGHECHELLVSAAEPPDTDDRVRADRPAASGAPVGSTFTSDRLARS